MAGCFGNSAYDRYLERESDIYNRSFETYECDTCDHVCSIDDLKEEDGRFYCPECNKDLGEIDN